MDSRAYLLQLQAAAAAAPPVHAADADEPEPTPKASLLEFEARGAAHAPAPRQGGTGGLAPMVVVVGNSGVIKCPECPKWFASEKAMFGHLRKHPERGYKGATRPTTPRAAAASVAGDKQKPKKQVVARKEAGVPAANITGAADAIAAEKRPREEAEHSTKWPTTPKLGWAAVQAASSEDEEAAMILLEMASSTSRSSSETQQQSVQPVRAPDAGSRHDQMPPEYVEQQPMLLDHHVAGHQTTPEAEQMVQVQPAGHALELSADAQTPVVKQLTNLEITTKAVLIVVPVKANKPAIFPAGPASVVPVVATKAKKLRVQHLEQTAAASSPAPGEGAASTPPPRRIPSPASDKKFECPICGKLFPSYQALGGHVSSHAKTARHDDLAAAQATQNILVHRNQQSARHEDLDAAQATQNILVHRNQQSARHEDLDAAKATQNILVHRNQTAGSVSIMDSSAAAGAGVGAFVQERLDSQPPAPAPTPPPQRVAPPPPPHVCDVCLLTFSSGQALGGHKRKHWFPEKQAAKIALAAAAVPAPELRDFDLNELPQEGRGENNQP